MFTTRRLYLSSLLLLCLLNTALAQSDGQTGQGVGQKAAQTGTAVTAAATAERVRFTAPSNVVRMQLQVISDTGQVLFEVSSKGNVLDWSLQDGSGQRVQGAYLTVVTVKSLSGRVSERIGSVSVAEQQVELSAVEATGLTAAQQQAVGPIEEHASLTILNSDEGQAVTVLANNGTEGQIIRERGALSFRLGEFYTGKDTEQMRLTEEGNLGIGTDKPQAKLDVAGTIRVEKGIEFADGTVQTTGLSGRKDKDGNLMPNVAGTGTQNRLAKWTDNAGTLGNSNVTEAASGKLGIGIVNPNYEITLFGNDVGLQLISAATGTTANDGFRFGISSVNNAFLWNTEATDMYFGTTATERMRIKATGNVGIGTSNPAEKLEVAGKVKLSGAGAGLTFADGTTQTTAATGGVSGPGTTNFVPLWTGATALGDSAISQSAGNVGVGVVSPAAKLDVAGNINTTTHYNIGGARMLSVDLDNIFAGINAGLNTTGSNNSFFGKDAGLANTTASGNSFFGSSAGFSNTMGSSNSFFGFRAGNLSTTGNFNSFFGSTAGLWNTTGSSNSFFGFQAGNLSTTGNFNSFFGDETGFSNTTGSDNSFVGRSAGSQNTTGFQNAFFGRGAGVANTMGSNNTLIGFNANVGSGNLTNATAIGANALATVSDSVVLGSNANVGIGMSSFPNGFGGRLLSVASSALDNGGITVGGNGNGEVLYLYADTTLNYGGIQAKRPAGSLDHLVLQEQGGNVGIGTNTPQRKLHISDAMRLQPIASPPASPVSGDLYFDTSEALCVHVSGAWTKLAGTGTCQ